MVEPYERWWLRGRQWPLMLGMALAVRLVVVFGLLGGMGLLEDPHSYSLQALAIRDHFPGPDHYYLPPGLGYVGAAVTWLLGDSLTVFRLMSIGFSLAVVALVRLVAGEFFREDRRVALVAGWIAVCYGPEILMAGQFYPYVPSHVAILLLVWLAAVAWRTGRWWWLALAGVAFAWAALIRPGSLAVGGMLALAGAWGWWRTPSPNRAARTRLLVAGGAAFAAITVALVLPAMLHNHRNGWGLTISTNNEANFFFGNCQYTPLYKTSHLAQRAEDEFEPEAVAYIARIRAEARSAPYDAQGKVYMREALAHIKARPDLFVLRTFNRFCASWGFDYIMSRNIQHAYRLGNLALLGLLLVEAGSYGIVMLLALWWLTAAWPWPAPWRIGVLLAVAMAYLAPHFVAFSAGVYHLSIMGLIMPLAAAALVRRCQQRLPMKASTLVAWGLLAGIQAVYAWFAVIYA
jgi:hypothetical protein